MFCLSVLTCDVVKNIKSKFERNTIDALQFSSKVLKAEIFFNINVSSL